MDNVQQKAAEALVSKAGMAPAHARHLVTKATDAALRDLLAAADSPGAEAVLPSLAGDNPANEPMQVAEDTSDIDDHDLEDE